MKRETLKRNLFLSLTLLVGGSTVINTQAMAEGNKSAQLLEKIERELDTIDGLSAEDKAYLHTTIQEIKVLIDTVKVNIDEFMNNDKKKIHHFVSSFNEQINKLETNLINPLNARVAATASSNSQYHKTLGLVLDIMLDVQKQLHTFLKLMQDRKNLATGLALATALGEHSELLKKKVADEIEKKLAQLQNCLSTLKLNTLVNCVDEVRKEIIKRKNAPPLKASEKAKIVSILTKKL